MAAVAGASSIAVLHGAQAAKRGANWGASGRDHMYIGEIHIAEADAAAVCQVASRGHQFGDTAYQILGRNDGGIISAGDGDSDLGFRKIG